MSLVIKPLILLILIATVNSDRKKIGKGKFKCKDFGGIKKEVVERIQTRSRQINETVISVPDKIEIEVMKRDVWNAYCYHGSKIDPNTGCGPKGVTVLLPDQMEAKSWHHYGKCKIGVTCRVDQEDCKGDGALKCLNNELTTWVSGSQGGYGEWWLRFPHHTCAKLWNCEIKKDKISPVMIVENSLRLEINIMDEWFTIYKNGVYTNYFKSVKHNLVVYVADFNVDSRKQEMRCVKSQEQSECVLHNVITGVDEVVELTETKWLIGRTVAVEMSGKKDGYLDVSKQRDEFMRAASINDLKRVILSTHYTQAEIDNNFELANINFMKIVNLLTGLIEYTTKKDDKAYSVITGEPKVMKWIDPNIVRVCDTHREFWKEKSSCVNGSYYAGGTYHLTRRYKCHKPDLATETYDLNLNLGVMKDAKIYDVSDMGTTSSERINRELVEERINEIESKLDSQYDPNSDPNASSLGGIGYLKTSWIFSLISDYLVYINSLAIVILLLRR